MAKIFISYKSEERPQIAELETVLHHLGFEVWFDENLVAGQSWWEQILQQIREADVVVLAISQRYLRSLPCERERDYAIALRKYVIPIVIDDTFDMNRLPPSISALQTIHFSGTQDATSILTLARACIAVPESQPLPDPLPPPPPIPLVDVSRLMDMMATDTDLTLDEQEMLFTKLSQIIETVDDEKEQQDALSGLLTLRNHSQLWNSIADRIDNLLITLPEHLREQGAINHPNIRVDTQRRLITAMMVSIASFTNFSETLEPEDVFSTYNRYINLIDDCIRAVGGIVDNLAGNRVMGLFNTQLNPQEDHAIRATHAAMMMASQLHTLHEVIPEHSRLFFATGIHSGIVTLGNVRTANRDKLSIIGDTINITERVQTMSYRGDILVTQSVYERILDDFEYEHFGELPIMGRASYPQIYRITRQKRSFFQNPIVDEELLTLLDELEDKDD